MDLATEALHNEKLSVKIKQHMSIDSRKSKKHPDTCDQECRQSLYCQLTSNDFDDYSLCQGNDKANFWMFAAF